MARQHATPILLTSEGAVSLSPLGLAGGADGVPEDEIQRLIQEHPSCLPIAEVDPMFCNPVPICRELNTIAGPIDNFMVTASGLPVLVECKLWRNPEGRREVVGQILDYAKELTRWSSSDLDREVRRRRDARLIDLVRAAGHEVDEVDFNDAITFNLRRGRFLLLIVGDGIREGVEAITEYLQGHAHLHFSLGLVEMPIYLMGDGQRVVVPRVLAQTQLVTRNVVSVPEGYEVQEEVGKDAEADPDRRALGNEQEEFWSEFLAGLQLDDPEQRRPKPVRTGSITFPLPGPGGTIWLTVYRNKSLSEVGLFLSYNRQSDGERVVQRILDEDREAVLAELNGTAEVFVDSGQKSVGSPRTLIGDKLKTGAWADPTQKARAFQWLRQRTNEFLNVLRPRVRAVTADVKSETL